MVTISQVYLELHQILYRKLVKLVCGKFKNHYTQQNDTSFFLWWSAPAYGRCYGFVYKFFETIFSCVQKTFPWFDLTIESQIDFVFYTDVALDLPK